MLNFCICSYNTYIRNGTPCDRCFISIILQELLINLVNNFSEWLNSFGPDPLPTLTCH